MRPVGPTRMDGYVRVSRRMGRGGPGYISPNVQREAIQRWADYRNVEIVAWHVDEDESGGTQARPGLRAAMARIEAGETDGLACWRLNRFARNVGAAIADYIQCENDRKNIAYAKRTLHDIWEAAGAQDVLSIDRYAHLVGGCRMGTDPERSVVDSDHRAWGIPNLFIADGSVMPTQGFANPALTIMALASRLAERLSDGRLDAPGAEARRSAARGRSTLGDHADRAALLEDRPPDVLER